MNNYLRDRSDSLQRQVENLEYQLEQETRILEEERQEYAYQLDRLNERVDNQESHIMSAERDLQDAQYDLGKERREHERALDVIAGMEDEISALHDEIYQLKANMPRQVEPGLTWSDVPAMNVTPPPLLEGEDFGHDSRGERVLVGDEVVTTIPRSSRLWYPNVISTDLEKATVTGITPKGFYLKWRVQRFWRHQRKVVKI